ncbi:MAG: ABC transporter ATP-binding protein [Spirochaetales bacterium]
MKNKNACNYFFEWTKNHRVGYVFSIIFATLSVAGGIVPFYAISKIIALLWLKDLAFENYVPWLIITACGFLLQVIAHHISTLLSHKNTFIILGEIRQKMCDKLAKMPMGNILARSSGEMKNLMIEKVDSIEPSLAHLLPELTSKLLVPIAVGVLIFLTDWRLGFISLITLPVGALFYMLMMIGYEKKYNRYLVATKQLNAVAVEYINGIEVIKAFNNSDKSYKKFTDTAHEAANSAIDWMRDSQLYFAIALSVIPATLLPVLPASIIFFVNGSLSFSAMITVIILSLALLEPLVGAMGYGEVIANIGLIVRDIASIIDEEELHRPDTEVPLDDYTVSFDNVSFGYGEQEILHGINTAFKSGDVTALVGPSGSGKSTIAKLIASMWDVKSGTIRIGKTDIRNIPLAQLNAVVAYVSQDNYLFDESITENIRKGKLDASDEEVIRMAKASGCHDFIMQLENGYDTVAGGAGGHLSGGERQRIAIARAMLKDSPIVILDEATAYTDPENEAIIQEAVSTLVKGKTLIVVAHRLSTITDSDKIIVVKDGKIESEGSHEQLLQTCELYKDLYNAHIGAKDSEEV